MALVVEHEDRTDVTSVITLRGKLMLGAESAQLETLVPELIKRGRKNLVFDLGGVTHIDSTGIGRFIDTYSRLTPVGGKMRLACPTAPVRDAFHVTRLDTVFTFFLSVDEACEGL